MYDFVCSSSVRPEGLRDQPELLLEVDKRAVESFLHVVAPPAETGHQEIVLRLGLGRLLKMLAEVHVC